MSAVKARGRCPIGDPHRVRYRSRHQARKGLDRARVALRADGVPPELWPVGWHRCPSRDDGGCNGWHLHVGLGARHLYFAARAPLLVPASRPAVLATA